MTVTEILPVSYPEQSRADYCGAACAQVVLAQLGAGLLPQDDLYREGRAHSSDPNWGIAPDGLSYILNHYAAGISRARFRVARETNAEALSRRICWTIHHARYAPVVAVRYGRHWVVVRGYAASAAPASSTDQSYSILGFEVGDPEMAPERRGSPDQRIPYGQWQSAYLTKVAGRGWAGCVVGICGSDAAEDPPSL